METVKIKHREFNIVQNVSEHTFVGERKNKKFFIRKFEPKTQEAKELTYAVRKLSTSGVKVPKTYFIDEKLGYIVSEYIEGELVMNYLSSNEMNESLYDSLFKSAYMAKRSGMTLNYEIDKWMISKGELIYIYPMFIIYKKEKDLVDRYIRLWFNTKELAEFMAKNKVSYDKKRLKDEYLTNKEIVLMLCKYYR